MKRLIILAAGLLLSLQAFAATQIVNLRTEAMETPLGLDEAHPYFSWQMKSDRIGALQRAYRVLVATGKPDFSGTLAYDSGMVRSDASLNIPYEGAALRPSTRYWWKVQVWDQDNALVESEPSWFETGLMGSGWSRAEWIGSQEVGASKYRTFFDIDYDVQIPAGSSRAVFAYSVKDEKNWITAELNVEGSPKFIIDYAVEGDVRHLSTIDIADRIPEAGKHAVHHVRLQVGTPGYHLKSLLIVHFDGQVLHPTEGVPGGPPRENVNSGNRTQMEITPYPSGEYITDWARLHSIGFRQPRGQKAIFSNIVISEENWKTTLYTDPVERHELSGSGRLEVWEPYGLVSAPMLRKEVTFDKPVKDARLYVTARGIYEFYINGKRVSNDYYNPGWTDFRYRIMYNSYDVPPQMKRGANAFGAMLGSGL